jgi:hypothetical protein
VSGWPAVRYHPRMASRPSPLASLRGIRFARLALLWLALVMGLAQTVAVRHTYSHTTAETLAQNAGKHPGGLAHCESCIAAAAIGGAAPPSAPLLFAAAAQELPQFLALAAPHFAPQQRPYAIRAPPAFAS